MILNIKLFKCWTTWRIKYEVNCGKLAGFICYITHGSERSIDFPYYLESV